MPKSSVTMHRTVLTLGIFACGLLLVPSAHAAPPFSVEPPSGPKGPPEKTVTVDCSQGKTIANALQAAAESLVIEIRGICDEDVYLNRSDVTLRGSDPNVDGIRGVKPADVPGGVLTVERANSIVIENLAILDGLRDGVVLLDVGSVQVFNSRIVGHARNGLFSIDGNFVRVFDTEIEAARWAVAAGDDAFCTRCTIHGGAAAWIDFSGQQGINDSTLTSDSIGVWSQVDGHLSVARSTIDAPGLVAVSLENAVLNLTDTTIDSGWMYCGNQSSLTLRNSQQNSNLAGFNLFEQQALVSLFDGSRLEGLQILLYFSNIAIDDGPSGSSVVDGDLACGSASDAWCPSAAVNVTGASCGQCI